jgi:hypothetical protein
MKHKIKELDVDFIGEQNQPLTKEEQLEISVFIQKLKNERKYKNNSIIRKKEKQFA